MPLPSREFVISEVDREFLLQHPESPRQLNPDDPAQARLAHQWNVMFHEFLSRTVDSHFFRSTIRSSTPSAPENGCGNSRASATA